MTIKNEYGPTLPISEEIHKMKYRGTNETFREAMTRVAEALKDDEGHFDSFRTILYNQRFLPAGRVQSAMGSPREVTPYNCFVSEGIQDSMDGIMAAARDAAQTMRLGGGIGYDFSTLRPRGALIKSLDSRSSGPLSFMGIFDAVCKTIASAGHRRGAQMGVLRVDHPDIEEFIRAKNNSTELTQFNISVGVTDAFMEAVKYDTDFNLVFDGRVYKTIKAKALWDEILRSTWDWAEPEFSLLIVLIKRTTYTTVRRLLLLILVGNNLFRLMVLAFLVLLTWLSMCHLEERKVTTLSMSSLSMTSLLLSELWITLSTGLLIL